MDTKTMDKIVSIFKERILTPVLYMTEHEDFIELVCFCDANIEIDVMYSTTTELEKETGYQFEIVDIREFCEEDRLEVLSSATLLYAEDKLLEFIFTTSMLEDYKLMLSKRSEMMTRYEENNSPYLQ